MRVHDFEPPLRFLCVCVWELVDPTLECLIIMHVIIMVIAYLVVVSMVDTQCVVKLLDYIHASLVL